jgi:hypothetical protein
MGGMGMIWGYEWVGVVGFPLDQQMDASGVVSCLAQINPVG